MSFGQSSPSPPPQPTGEKAIQKWVELQPTVYQQQLEMAPKEAQQQVQLAEQFAQPLGEAYLQAQKAMFPETTALTEQMATQAAEGMEQGLSPEEQEYYRDIYASQLGTNVGSPIGADYTARGLLRQQQQRQDYYRNLGLSVSQRQPLAQPQEPQTTDYMSQFTPNAMLGFNAQNYATRSSMYSPQQQQDMGGIGAAAGAGLGALFAAPKGGMSMLEGGALGSSIGGGLGSSVYY